MEKLKVHSRRSLDQYRLFYERFRDIRQTVSAEFGLLCYDKNDALVELSS